MWELSSLGEAAMQAPRFCQVHRVDPIAASLKLDSSHT